MNILLNGRCAQGMFSRFAVLPQPTRQVSAAQAAQRPYQQEKAMQR